MSNKNNSNTEESFLEPQPYLENQSMYVMQSGPMDENYYNNVFETFPQYTSPPPYMPNPPTHRGSLPLIYDSMIPSKPKETTTMEIDRRFTESAIPKLKRQRKRKEPEDDQRRQFLERNRVAALKCRQRKKQWLADLQDRVEYLASDNENLQSQTSLLREEVISLKTLLLAHKDCKVAQSNGITLNVIQNLSSVMPSKRVHGM
ncbi:hypothetical protein BY458DRAFT_509874 [Sporodiniella umbellata]|nr:hypothetical protein BY458DRAFT_509874 [Sporodiniella umbellata]